MPHLQPLPRLGYSSRTCSKVKSFGIEKRSRKLVPEASFHTFSYPISVPRAQTKAENIEVLCLLPVWRADIQCRKCRILITFPLSFWSKAETILKSSKASLIRIDALKGGLFLQLTTSLTIQLVGDALQAFLKRL